MGELRSAYRILREESAWETGIDKMIILKWVSKK
jgi:hypothetical protein